MSEREREEIQKGRKKNTRADREMGAFRISQMDFTHALAFSITRLINREENFQFRKESFLTWSTSFGWNRPFAMCMNLITIDDIL